MKTLAVGVLAAALLSTTAFAAPTTYAIDKSHMQVGYTISHVGFSLNHGRFHDVDATLTLDPAAPAASKVAATIKVASIDTDDVKRNEHLQTPDFFDAAKYPTITFVSTKVTPTGPKTAKVAGNLTIHGVTKPVVLDATLVNLGEHPLTKHQAAGMHATVAIKRSDFGVKGFLPAVGDDVNIVIDAEFQAK
jgi:polyisoprenoid-binding protein YceI